MAITLGIPATLSVLQLLFGGAAAVTLVNGMGLHMTPLVTAVERTPAEMVTAAKNEIETTDLSEVQKIKLTAYVDAYAAKAGLAA